MGFNTIQFLFIFLPITLVVFFVVPSSLKKLVLTLASLIFYIWGGPTNLAYLLLISLFNYLTGRELELLKSQERTRALRNVIITSVVANVAILCFFKYSSQVLPLGISFYTFTSLSYLFDVYYDKAKGEKNPIDFLLYVCFFPKLVSGPIVRYSEMEEQIKHHTLEREDLFEGSHLFIVGLLKKVLLADPLGVAFAGISGGSGDGVVDAWLIMILYSLQLYFDFSGYSDMAIGLARVFGFKFEKNFDHPYLSKSISEFWRRWHISLGNWFKEYVYFPMGGSRVRDGRLLLNLTVVWALTGIWHGSTLKFIMWGFYHGFFVILERFVIKDRFNGIPGWIRMIFTDLIAFIGWIFFFAPTFTGAIGHIGALFGIGTHGLLSENTLFFMRENIILIVIAIIGCGTLPAKSYGNLLYKNVLKLSDRSLKIITALATGVLLLLTISGVVANTYSSFLYFNF